ncbi:unnamed protein product, partial [Anisakis simplex]|uniref:Ell-associated factor Eaf n=1 Tax=Anisakis simplex TaxID=6269 RepID=A0A0M3KGD1_ANISI
AENVWVEDGDIFQSEILQFKRNVLIEANGIARIDDDSEVLLLDDRRAEGPFSRGAQLLPVQSKASLLYYKQYNSNGIEMNEGFFSTERRYCELQFFQLEDSSKGEGDQNVLIFQFSPSDFVDDIERIVEKSENDDAERKIARSMVEPVAAIDMANKKVKNSPIPRRSEEVYRRAFKFRSASYEETKRSSTIVEKRRNSESSKLSSAESHSVGESIFDEHPIKVITDTLVKDTQNLVAENVQLSKEIETIANEQRNFENKSGGNQGESNSGHMNESESNHKQGDSEPVLSYKQNGSKSRSSNNSSQTSEYDIIGVSDGTVGSDTQPLSDRPSCSTAMSHQLDFETEHPEVNRENDDEDDDVFQSDDAILLEEKDQDSESSSQMQIHPLMITADRYDVNSSDVKRKDLFSRFANVDDLKAKRIL